MGEFDVIVFVLQRAVLDVRDLAKAVHVQLTDERGEIVVLEIARQDLSRESRLIVDVKRATRRVPCDQIVTGRVVDQCPEFSEKCGDHRLSCLLQQVALRRTIALRVHICKRKRRVQIQQFAPTVTACLSLANRVSYEAAMFKCILLVSLVNVISAVYSNQKCYICDQNGCDHPGANDIKACSDSSSDGTSGKTFVQTAFQEASGTDMNSKFDKSLTQFGTGTLGINSTIMPKWEQLTRWVKDIFALAGLGASA